MLCSDLKGSTEYIAELDPEDARSLLDPILERMMDAVGRYEGTINQVMGDGIQALFGAPIAYEDHAVRACFAALKMQELIRKYAEEVRRTRGVPLLVRVGLNSGEVVVRSMGSELHMNYSAHGQAVHLGRAHGADGRSGHDSDVVTDAASGAGLCHDQVARPDARQGAETARAVLRIAWVPLPFRDFRRWRGTD